MIKAGGRIRLDDFLVSLVSFDKWHIQHGLLTLIRNTFRPGNTKGTGLEDAIRDELLGGAKE